MAFEQLIKQPMSVSGDLESQYIHILSFHPNTTTSNITAYNANINRLLERFDEYHLLYKLGQGAHAATRVHTVLTR